MAEAETAGTRSARRSRRSPSRRRTEPLFRTEQSGSLGHRPGTRRYWRTCTYWCTTSAAARAGAARAAARAAAGRVAAARVAAGREAARAGVARAGAARAAVARVAVAMAMAVTAAVMVAAARAMVEVARELELSGIQ
jgi:hypothetical protein